MLDNARPCTGDDAVLAALDDVVAVLRANSARNDRAIARAAAVRDMRADGLSWREITAGTDGPLIVEMMSANIDGLRAAGSRLRRLQAQALHREGLTMDQIAALFNVTRQRVSALLKRTR